MQYTTAGSWQTTEEHIYIKISYIFILWQWCLCGAEEQSESVHIQRRSCQESDQPAGTDFSQNSRPYIVLKLPRDPCGHTSSPTQCSFFIGHVLHPRNDCSPLVTTYTHTFFMLWISCPRIACFLVVTLLILSTTRCICQLHPPSPSPIKAIYHSRVDWVL